MAKPKKPKPQQQITFEKLTIDTKCHCISEKCCEDTETVFLRRTLYRVVDERDYKSYWELGRWVSKSASDCKQVCKAKGLSIYKSPDADHLVEKWKESIRISPQMFKERFYCRIRFRPNAGVVLHSPGRETQHHTFYKCDAFRAKRAIVVVDIQPL
jgi:hypothetical protein